MSSEEFTVNEENNKSFDVWSPPIVSKALFFSVDPPLDNSVLLGMHVYRDVQGNFPNPDFSTKSMLAAKLRGYELSIRAVNEKDRKMIEYGWAMVDKYNWHESVLEEARGIHFPINL